MNFKTMLQGFSCSCGKTHTCEIDTVIIEKGALRHLREVVADYRSILVVADANTFSTCGETVLKELGEQAEDTVIFSGQTVLVPNEAAVEEVFRHITDRTDCLLGIGAGVIQDLCKYTSFTKNLPYMIVATAPSMDGYASNGAAMIMENRKITYNARVPKAILGDVDILKDAPMELIQAGYGDILGKYSCLNDWKLSHAVNNEYFCDTVYGLTMDMLLRVKDLPEKLLSRDESAIQTLMEALIGAGIAMAYVGNSRPASGSEHHLSHFFEIVGLLEEKPYFPHGIDVAYSAVCTQKLREELLTISKPGRTLPIAWPEYQKRIRAIYHAAADGVIALQEKMGWYKVDRYPTYLEKWEEICTILREVPSSQELSQYLSRMGLDDAAFIEEYGEEKIKNSIWFAKDLKDRYSVLWLYFDLQYTAKDAAAQLKNKKLFLLDMDGTVYLDEALFAGVTDFLKTIESSGANYLFLTNNSSRNIEEYVQKVNRLGIPATAKNFLTSTDATALYLASKKYHKIYAFGTKTFAAQLAASGLPITTEREEDIDCLCMGFDTELTFQKLEDACILLGKGVDYIATNPDWVCPTWYGSVPDCGSIAQILETATGRKPLFIGKPQPTMAKLAMEKMGVTPPKTVMIGDRLYTDIASGVNADIDTLFVLSGEGIYDDIASVGITPTYVFEDIQHLVTEWNKE